MSFDAIDLSSLPAPEVVEELDFEAILAAQKATLLALYPDFDADLESDPVIKVLEVASYREVQVRQRVNDAARACMLAYATGADLEHLAALLVVSRLTLDEGDEDTDPTYETDDSLRTRAQLAPEGMTVAGSEGSYQFHGLAVAGVKGIGVASPEPCEVLVTVLALDGDGTPTQDLLDAVDAALTPTDVRPLTDHVTVQAADVIEYAVTATIYTASGPDAEVVRANAEASVQAFVEGAHALGQDVHLSAVHAALHVDGVSYVDLTVPDDTITVSAAQAAYCTSVTVTHGGVNG
jgi:phage-related baseplate assembly protein